MVDRTFRINFLRYWEVCTYLLLLCNLSIACRQRELLTYNRKLITRSLDNADGMPWSLEAGFALAALILTLIFSGLGLVLKYRRGLHLGSDKLGLAQLLVEGMILQCTCMSVAHAARSGDR